MTTVRRLCRPPIIPITLVFLTSWLAPGLGAPIHAGRVLATAPAGQRHSWRAPDARGRGLLYVGLFNSSVVNIYRESGQNQPLAGQLSDGVGQPTGGLAVDSKARLYVVSDANSAVVFQPGALMPTGVYRMPNGSFPGGIAVGSDFTFDAPLNNVGPLVQFAKANRRSPDLTIDFPAGDAATAAALDSQNNLYIGYGPMLGSPAGYFEKCPPGSSQCTNLGITLSADPHAVAIDVQGNLVACDEAKAQIDIFPSGATQPSRTISSGLQGCAVFALDSAADRLFVANQGSSGAGVIAVFDYSSGKLVNTISAGIPSNDSIDGIAVSPASPSEGVR